MDRRGDILPLGGRGDRLLGERFTGDSFLIRLLGDESRRLGDESRRLGDDSRRLGDDSCRECFCFLLGSGEGFRGERCLCDSLFGDLSRTDDL